MALRNDGGDFSDDPFTRLLAMKNGSASADDLAQGEQNTGDAQKQAMNAAMGSMSVPSGSALQALAAGGESAAADTGISMADKIRQAANSSAVKVIPSELDNASAQFAKEAEGNPNFFEQFGAKGVSRNVPDQQMAQYQTGLRQQAQQEQLAQQLQQRKYQAIQNALKGTK